MSATLSTVPILDVHVEPGLNARRQEAESELEALRDSVARHGVLQPLLVRPSPGIAASPPRSSRSCRRCRLCRSQASGSS
jgi:hypothetical protein